MRILQVSSDPPSYHGGIGGLIGILERGLRRRGHEVVSLSPMTRFGEVKLTTLGMRDFSRFDVVHVHGPAPTLSDLIRLNPTVRTLVLTYHCDVEWLSTRISSAYRNVHRLLYSRSDCVIVTSNDYRRRYGKSVARIEVIPLPGPTWDVDPNVTSKKDTTFRVLFVGQFRPYKGLSLLLRVAEMMPNVRFSFAGNGRLDPAVRRAALRIPNVEVLGALEEQDLKSEYSRAHVICLPSVNTMEAFGIVLLEGATFGALPVASDLPGVRENLRTLGGEAFPVGDWGRLKAIISALSASPETWQAKSLEAMARARDYSNRYTPDWFVNKHEEIYVGLTSPASPLLR